MLVSLRKQATTTPKVRAANQASDEPACVLADRYCTSDWTVWKWRKRAGLHNLSHTPHWLLTAAEEAVAVYLRMTLLLLLLDEFLAVVRELLKADVSRSGLDN
ncbi:MAG: hypothetical protein AAF675_00020 [Pseudomonadota bacterium]